MDSMLPAAAHGRKFRLVAVAILILLTLTCYFCWEILYQERVILNILRMSRTAGSATEPKIPLTSDHLEEVVEAWFEQKKQEVMLLILLCTAYLAKTFDITTSQIIFLHALAQTYIIIFITAVR